MGRRPDCGRILDASGRIGSEAGFESGRIRAGFLAGMDRIGPEAGFGPDSGWISSRVGPHWVGGRIRPGFELVFHRIGPEAGLWADSQHGSRAADAARFPGNLSLKPSRARRGGGGTVALQLARPFGSGSWRPLLHAWCNPKSSQ